MMTAHPISHHTAALIACFPQSPRRKTFRRPRHTGRERRRVGAGGLEESGTDESKVERFFGSLKAPASYVWSVGEKPPGWDAWGREGRERAPEGAKGPQW